MKNSCSFVSIRVASQTKKSHEQFRLEKYLCHLRYLCDNKKISVKKSISVKSKTKSL